MDQFYGDVYCSIIYQWLLNKKDDYQKRQIEMSIDSQYAQRLIFQYKNVKGIIEFWNQQHIIEETILNQDEELLFYLHYTTNHLSGLKNFIHSFFQQLLSYPQSRYIGISCSLDVTSSHFIVKLQELSNLLNLPYYFKSVPVYDISNSYHDFDMILLAPQIAYLEPQLKNICQDQCIIKTIETSDFATNDYQKVLDMIQDDFIL